MKMKWFIVFIYFLLIGFNISLFSFPVGWEDNKLLFDKGVFQVDITHNKANIFIAYVRHIADNSEIFFKASKNEGRTWLKEKRITTAEGSSENPTIVYIDKKIYIFWVDFRNGNNDIYFTYSLDTFGKQFKEEVCVSLNKSDSINPVIATSGDYIYLIWSDDKTGDYELYIKSFDIYKEKWSEEVQITKYSGGSFYASVISLLDEIHLCWQQRDGKNWKVMYSKSDNGIIWLKPINVSEGLDNAYTPFLGTSPEGIMAIFQGYQNYESDLYLSIFNVFDIKWSIPFRITSDLHIERYPVFINTAKEFNVFWLSLFKENNDIFYAKSFDMGTTFQEKINLSLSKGDSHDYKVVHNIFNDNVYIIWQQGNQGKVYFKKKDTFCPTPHIIAGTHKENVWSIKKDIKIKWQIDQDKAGIKDFAYILDQYPNTVPELFLAEYPINEAHFYDVKNGIWFFHLRARNNVNNISPTVHYKVMINYQLDVSKEKYYVVKYGDRLWDIAEKYYKNPKMYKDLAKYNDIKDPDWIYPHQIIKIPSKKYIKSKEKMYKINK